MDRDILTQRTPIVVSAADTPAGRALAANVWTDDPTSAGPGAKPPARSRLSGRRFSSRWRQLPTPALLFNDWDEV